MDQVRDRIFVHAESMLYEFLHLFCVDVVFGEHACHIIPCRVQNDNSHSNKIIAFHGNSNLVGSVCADHKVDISVTECRLRMIAVLEPAFECDMVF